MVSYTIVWPCRRREHEVQPQRGQPEARRLRLRLFRAAAVRLRITSKKLAPLDVATSVASIVPSTRCEASAGSRQRLESEGFEDIGEMSHRSNSIIHYQPIFILYIGSIGNIVNHISMFSTVYE